MIPRRPRSLDLEGGLEDIGSDRQTSAVGAHRPLPKRMPVQRVRGHQPGNPRQCQERSQGEEAVRLFHQFCNDHEPPCCSSVTGSRVRRPRLPAFGGQPHRKGTRWCSCSPSPRGARSPPCWLVSAFEDNGPLLMLTHVVASSSAPASRRSRTNIRSKWPESQSALEEGDTCAGCGLPFPATAWRSPSLKAMTIPLPLKLMPNCAAGPHGRGGGPWPWRPRRQLSHGCAAHAELAIRSPANVQSPASGVDAPKEEKRPAGGCRLAKAPGCWWLAASGLGKRCR